MPGNDTMPQALQDFAKEAETEFHRVEDLLSNSTLDLEEARNVVLSLRTLAQEHRGRGCDDLQMEKWIMQRTGRILENLVTGAEPVRWNCCNMTIVGIVDLRMGNVETRNATTYISSLVCIPRVLPRRSWWRWFSLARLDGFKMQVSGASAAETWIVGMQVNNYEIDKICQHRVLFEYSPCKTLGWGWGGG